MPNTENQGLQVIICPGNVMPTAKVQPLHIMQHIAKFVLHHLQGTLKGIGILLAHGVKVKAVQISPLLPGQRIQFRPGASHTGSGGTRIIQ